MSADPQYTNTQVLNMVNKLLNYVQSDSMKKLRTSSAGLYRKACIDTFPTFFDNTPSLFNLIVDEPDGFDFNRLKKMLALKTQVENKNTSYEEASTRLGQEYYDEFVKPRIDE